MFEIYRNYGPGPLNKKSSWRVTHQMASPFVNIDISKIKELFEFFDEELFDQTEMNSHFDFFNFLVSSVMSPIEVQTQYFNENNEEIYYYSCSHMNILGDVLKMVATVYQNLSTGFNSTTTNLIRTRFNEIHKVAIDLFGQRFTCELLRIAQEKNITVLPVDAIQQIYQLGSGNKSKLISHSVIEGDSYLGSIISDNKITTHRFLSELGIPVPRQVIIRSKDDFQNLKIPFSPPYVVKPSSQDKGRGVFAGITEQTLQQAYSCAAAFDAAPVLIQEQIIGNDHRVMVVNGRFNYASHRKFPIIIGDGRSTILELIEELNTQLKILKKQTGVGISEDIQNNPSIRLNLHKNGITFDTIPEEGKEIVLQEVANLSMGGSRCEVTETVHPSFKKLAERIAANLRVKNLGLDVFATDITKPFGPGNGVLIEMNIFADTRPERAENFLNQFFPSEEGSEFVSKVVVFGRNLKVNEEFISSLEGRYHNYTFAISSNLQNYLTPYINDNKLGAKNEIRFYQNPTEIIRDVQISHVIFFISDEEYRLQGSPTIAPLCITEVK